MAETPDPSGSGQSAPAETPALTAEDIQRLVNDQVQSLVTQRISGIQSVYDKQLAEANKKIRALQEDPDGYGATQNVELERQLQDAQRQLDAMKVARQYPDVAPVFEAIMGADSAEAQLEILSAFVQGRAAPASAPAQEPQPRQQATADAPVDPNRPLEGGPRGSADAMDGATAQSIIDSFGAQWPKFGG